MLPNTAPDTAPDTAHDMALEMERLPCRGCTRDCPNYSECAGRPWRLSVQLCQSLAWAGLRDATSRLRSISESRAL